jgi:hypothetical protein
MQEKSSPNWYFFEIRRVMRKEKILKNFFGIEKSEW